ncbi:unnamed protein product [Cyprideis torosa]|uniref:Sulfotransferase domain-containing protein n=1 Tax=Cyprideis torosa TaxID=163714 RepID=A0A7R8ZP35_9CRUS|nr:unnamed protein product [Cyprideis torosa]CAG0887682.1 unnamed protein product [Cyprideis torosa]
MFLCAVPAAVPNPKKSSEAAPKLPSAKKDEDDEFEWLLTPGGGRVKQRKEPSVKKNLVKRSSPNKDRTNSDLSGDGGDTGTSPTGEEPEPEDAVEEEVEDDPGPPLDAALLKIQKAYPWRNSSYPKRCQDLTVKFADINSLPVTALVSFPCSGNSLTRQLIEKASGIFTSSVYRDSSLEIGGFLGEKADAQLGVTILTKTHEFEQEHLDEFKKAVLLIRNPYRSILSFHHFLFKSHLGMAPSTNYFRDDWPTFCLSLAKRWAETIVAWVSSKPIHVVHYETLTDPKNQVDEIIKILKFLKFPVDESRLQCMKEDTNVIFKRKPGFYPDVDLFPRNVRATIDKAIVFVDKKLRQRKLPPMPLDKYEFFKDHPHTLKVESNLH